MLNNIDIWLQADTVRSVRVDNLDRYYHLQKNTSGIWLVMTCCYCADKIDKKRAKYVERFIILCAKGTRM